MNMDYQINKNRAKVMRKKKTRLAEMNCTPYFGWESDNDTVSVYSDRNGVEQILIGIDRPDVCCLPVLKTAVHAARAEHFKHGETIRIVFAPTFDENGQPRIRDMGDKERFEYIWNLTEHEAERCNRLWEQHGFNTAVMTGFLPILCSGDVDVETLVAAGKPSRTEYAVPEDARLALAALLNGKSGIPMEDIYVAKQVVSMQDVVLRKDLAWRDFNTQADLFFREGATFHIGRYDEQTTTLQSFYFPMYGTFLSTRLHLPRVLDTDQINAFSHRFMSPFIENEAQARRVAEGIGPDLCVSSTGLMTEEEVACMFLALMELMRKQFEAEINARRRIFPRAAKKTIISHHR